MLDPVSTETLTSTGATPLSINEPSAGIEPVSLTAGESVPASVGATGEQAAAESAVHARMTMSEIFEEERIFIGLGYSFVV